MEHISLPQLALLLVIVVLIFGTDSPLRRGTHDDVLSRLWEELQRLIFGTHRSLRRGRRVGVSRLRDELQRHMPVYSAETTKGNEAEFIRDRLPKRFPIALVVLAVLLFFGAAWWLSR